jgi:ParB family chromosome partitioning protein
MNAPGKKVAVKAVGSTAAKHQGSGLGLGDMGDLSALLNAPMAAANGGGPLMIDLTLIDEDPSQPRTKDNPGFTPESIGELAASYGPNGPKSPISLRDNRDAPGRYIINHGHRRYRAAKLKGLTVIPSFIDNDYHEVDQVIENLQRNDLTPREIADWIGRELAKGIKKGDIAKSLGKSPAFVSQHANLLDLPEPIAKVFNSGRANDVTVVNELVTAYKKNPKEVTAWLADENQEITRGEVKLLREFLEEKRRGEEEGDRDPNAGDASSGQTDNEASEGQGSDKKEKAADLEKLKKAIIQVTHDGRPARLILTRRPPAEGYAWLKYDDDGHEAEVNLVDVQLVALVEG